MREVMQVVLSLSLSGSILFLVVLAASRLLKQRFSRAWHYYVWLLVILRFLLPIAPTASPVGAVFAAFQQVPAPRAEAPAAQNPADAFSTTPPYEDGEALPYYGESAPEKLSFPEMLDAALQWLWVPWLGVALALLLRKVTLYQSFATYIRAGNAEVSNPVVLNRLAEVCETLRIGRQVELYENPLTAAPLMLGFFRPAVVLPSVQLSDEAFRYILLHELTHYRRRDIFYKWLMQLTLCLHWFNPLVYLLSREVNTAGELSCDEAVLGRLSNREQQAYGDVLIASLRYPGTYKQALAGLTLSENAQSVKERLQAIMKYHKMGLSSIVLSMLLTLLLAAFGVALGAATPGVTEAPFVAALPAPENKNEAYQLVAKMQAVDTSQSVADYTEAILAICEDAGTDLFAVMADSEIIDPADPLYAFSTGTLARTSSEVFADHSPPGKERAHVSAHATWERYATEEEKAAELSGFSEEERQAFLEATRDDPEYPVAMKTIQYFLYYDILSPESLTVDERDELLDAVLADMQQYVDEQSQEEVFTTGFEIYFSQRLARVAAIHSTDELSITGVFDSSDGTVTTEGE